MALPPAPGAPVVEPLTPAQFPLLHAGDLRYLGAFRLPVGSTQQSYAYGGQCLTYWPAHDSLILGGNDTFQLVGEVSIPAPSLSPTLSALPRAVVRQPLTDILAGKRNTVDGGASNPRLGGILVLGNRLVVSVYRDYDNVGQKTSHFLTGQTFSSLGSVDGPYQVGNGFWDIVPLSSWPNTPPAQAAARKALDFRLAGFASGYMCEIPSAYQTRLHASHLTGQGGKISILTRTSSGPSATVFSPSALAAPPVRGLVMGYPSDASSSSPLYHPTLGVWGVGGGLKLYDGSQGFRGVVFPKGSRSVLYFGWGGTHFCYGVGTKDPNLDGKPVPGDPGTHYCYDPTDGGQNKGTHGYPYRSLVYAYDADDFEACLTGKKKPWDVVPYATWDLPLPFQPRMVGGVDVGTYDLVGAAYDPDGKRLFVSASRCDGNQPLIHVFQVP